MLRRPTAIVLLAAAVLTAPASFARAQTSLARHCDTGTVASTPTHQGMHHAETAPVRGAEPGTTIGSGDGASCTHCASSACLPTSPCAGGMIMLTAASSSRENQAHAAAIEPSASRRPSSENHAPPTPPPAPSPIAS